MLDQAARGAVCCVQPAQASKGDYAAASRWLCALYHPGTGQPCTPLQLDSAWRCAAVSDGKYSG